MIEAMLYLLFQLGADRYALEASRVVEVVPLLDLRRLLQAPKGVAGVFNYRGRPVPAVDLSELALGQPSTDRLSTRIIVVKHPDAAGQDHLVGLVAENATETLRADPLSFVDSGVRLGSAPYLGPILMDAKGPVQLLHEQLLIPESVRNTIFSELCAPAP
jgi:chemotaxis-related protein WspB